MPQIVSGDVRARCEFDQFAANYEDLLDVSVSLTGESGEYFAAYKAGFMATAVVSKPDSKILDYGCGVGLVSTHLKARLPQARIDGLDVSQASLNRIDIALREQGRFVASVDELEKDYDVVFLANVMHHVEPQNRQSVISEAASCLRPGGKLVIFEHNPANPLTRKAVEQCPFDENVVLLPPRESEGYLREARMWEVHRSYIVFFPYWLKWLRPLESFLSWFPLGAQYALVGTKDRRATNKA